jgi:arginase
MKVTLIYAYWPNQPGGATWCDLPWALRDKGLPKRLHEAGHEVIESTLMAEEPCQDEMQAGLVLAAEISESVQEAVSQNELPVVLVGSCAIAALGAVAGLGPDTSIAWFDAHPDLNTPETSTSGLLEGMALAAATGKAWRGMTKTHAKLLRPAGLDRAILFGARDIDDAERSLIDTHKIPVTTDPELLAGRLLDATHVYAHLDMDVHDALAVRTTTHPVPGGVSAQAARTALTSINKISCIAVTGLDPAAPDAAKAAEIAIGHVLAVAGSK